MILQSSRYTNAVRVRATLADGSFKWAVLFERASDNRNVTYKYRTAAMGDRFDILAAQEYGDPGLWWLLARANPQVFFPDDIQAGVALRIPDAASIR